MSSTRSSRELYFVNKFQQSSSLSKSSSQEKAAIQAFVQTGRKRSRNVTRNRISPTISSTSKLPEACAKPPSSDDRARAEDDRPKTVHLAHQTLEPTISTHGHSQHSHGSGARHVLLPLLICQGVSCSGDPFNATSVSIDKPVNDLLHYYVNYYHPSQWPNEMALLRHGVYIHQTSVSRMMSNAMVNKLTMYCLLSAAACRLQFVDRLPCALVKGTESGYIRTAVRALASTFATACQQNPDQINHYITCMMLLSSAEAYRGNLSAAKTHLDAIKWLLKSNGGLIVIKDDCLRGQVAMTDLALACFDLRPCYFEPCYDPGPADLLRLSNREMEGLGPSCTASSLLCRVGSFVIPELMILAQEILESYTVKTRVLIPSLSAERAMQVTHWLTMRNMAIRSKLLAIKTIDQRVQAARTTMIMWTLLCMSITGRAKTTKVMAPKLRKILSQAPPEWAQDVDVKLWIMFVGLSCATNDSDEFSWFMGNCVSLSRRYLQLDTASISSAAEAEEQLVDFQRSFFFDSIVQQTRNNALAEQLYKAVSDISASNLGVGAQN